MSEFSLSKSAAIAEEWWRTLTVEPGPRGPRRTALARLRRAPTPVEVIQEPEAMRLIQRLPGENSDRVAVLAGVLAFVRATNTQLVARQPLVRQSVARAIGRKELDDETSALMSEMRFRRLLQAGDAELMESMRRLVRLAGREVNEAHVHGLSVAILGWGDAVKKKWIFEYYNVSEAGDLRDDRTGAAPSSPKHDQ